MTALLVYFEIAGHDDEALRAFYTRTFGWDFNNIGQVSAPGVLEELKKLT